MAGIDELRVLFAGATVVVEHRYEGNAGCRGLRPRPRSGARPLPRSASLAHLNILTRLTSTIQTPEPRGMAASQSHTSVRWWGDVGTVVDADALAGISLALFPNVARPSPLKFGGPSARRDRSKSHLAGVSGFPSLVSPLSIVRHHRAFIFRMN